MTAVEFARQNYPRFLEELKALLRIPSISTLPEHKGLRIYPSGRYVAGLVVISAVCCLARAQEKATPSTPNVFIRVAADASNLAAPGSKPWHIKAQYRQFKPDGTVEYDGVMEGWWASEDKFKISYTRANFAQTIYQDGGDAHFVGESTWPSSPEYDVSVLLLHPLPDEASITESVFSTKEVSAGDAKLQCLTRGLKKPGDRTSLDAQFYCFADAVPSIRLVQYSDGERVSFNEILRVNGQYLGRKIRSVKQPGVPFINIDVEKAEPLTSVDEATLTPPAEAQSVQKKVIFTAEITIGKRISGDPPEYPYEARNERVQGDVLLHGLISKEGVVTNLTVVSGPPELTGAALRAVKAWRYSPFTRVGLPVEVGIRVTVDFRIGISRTSH
jgi:TonB family protein